MVKSTFLSVSLIALSLGLLSPCAYAGTILSTDIAATCAVPSATSTGNTWYVDPVNGSITNNGSAAHPWDTLANVMVQKKSLIQGGDVIYLLSGNHGAVSAHKVNTDFVKVMAAPGQTPILSSLSVSGAKWLFSGLKIQGLAATSGTGPHVLVASAWDTPAAANNIIITNNIINSQDDTSSWTKDQWLQNAGSGIKVDGRSGTNCITVTGNTITGVLVGAGMFADQSLFAYNTIDHYADDALDYGGNYLTIANNKITNIIDVGDGMHLDCMQGFEPGGTGYDATTFTNVTIDSNMCIRQTDPNLKFATYFQGIDNFPGAVAWYNLTVTNNVVITNTYHGITFDNIHNAVIANNTVLADGEVTSSLYYGSTGLEMTTSSGQETWITVDNTSDHVDVRQNIAQTLVQGSGTDATIIFENNIASNQIALFLAGAMVYYGSPGTYGQGNVLSHELNAGFTVFDPSHYSYDLTLLPTSVAQGYGSTLPVIINPAVTPPVVTPPVVTPPVVTPPVVTPPVVTPPVVTPPVVTPPVVTKPVVTPPVVTKPVVKTQVVTVPASKKQGASKPLVSKATTKNGTPSTKTATKPTVSTPTVAAPTVAKPTSATAPTKTTTIPAATTTTVKAPKAMGFQTQKAYTPTDQKTEQDTIIK